MNGAVRTQKWNKSVCPSEGLGLDFAGLIMFIRHLKCYVIFQITSNFAFSMPSQVSLRSFSLPKSSFFTAAFTVRLEAEL